MTEKTEAVSLTKREWQVVAGALIWVGGAEPDPDLAKEIEALGFKILTLRMNAIVDDAISKFVGPSWWERIWRWFVPLSDA